MDETILILSLIALAAVLLLLIWRRTEGGVTFGLRPLAAYEELRRQPVRALESGRRLHMTPGRADLHTQQAPASVAGLGALADLSRETGMAPVVTVGAATLLPAAQGGVYRSYAASGRASEARFGDTQFLASQQFPFVYGAGATTAINKADVGSNVVLGHVGPEMALLAEAGRRQDLEQVLGSDDPTAMSVATVFTPNAVWGEELFAARAYLQRSPLQMASLRTQDVLRWLLAAGIIAAALLRLLGIIG
jgi:hypothetical protein